jgi:dUTPase
MRPRSSSFLAGVIVEGTIDHGYHDEVQVLCVNVTSEPVHIKQFQRVAQMIVQPIPRVFMCGVDELKPAMRSGFGSSGGVAGGAK